MLGLQGVVDQEDVGPASGRHAAGGGLAFVYLPKAAGIPVGREMPEPPGEKLAKGWETVLLVEDDQDVLEIVTAMMEDLKALGLTVAQLVLAQADEVIE